jgi:hypothetical protein
MNKEKDRNSHYQYKEFSVDKDPEKAYSFCLIGGTRSGKTTAMNVLLKKFFEKEINVLMSDSLHAEIYKPLLKSFVCCPTYIPEIIKMCYKINKGTLCKYPFNFVIDDLVGFRNDKEMLKLLTIYRNTRMGIILTGQGTSILNSTGRGNINFVLLFRLHNDEETEKVCKKYLCGFFPPGMKMIERIIEYKRLTTDHHFIFLNNLTGESYISKMRVSN